LTNTSFIYQGVINQTVCFPPEEVPVYLLKLQCGNILLLTIRCF